MLRNYNSWQTFAHDVFLVDLAPEDIVLISGWVKTSKWEIAVIDKHMRTQDIDIEARAAAFATARLSLSSQDGAAMSVSHRSSASDPHDQQILDRGCLFLRYFKLKRRRVLLPRSTPEIVTTISARDIDSHPHSKRSPDSSESRGSLLSRGGSSSLSSSTRSSKGPARPSLDSSASDPRYLSSTASTPHSPSLQEVADTLEGFTLRDGEASLPYFATQLLVRLLNNSSV